MVAAVSVGSLPLSQERSSGGGRAGGGGSGGGGLGNGGRGGEWIGLCGGGAHHQHSTGGLGGRVGLGGPAPAGGEGGGGRGGGGGIRGGGGVSGGGKTQVRMLQPAQSGRRQVYSVHHEAHGGL